MLKQIVLLLNLLTFIIVSALLPANIKIDTTLPDEFVRDSTYIIEVKITKGEIFGFAKFQQNLPAGFIAQPVETAEASFTFADGKAKFIWMAMPEQNEVTIKYALTASQDAPAEGVIEGKFSYIEENERKSYDIPNIPVKVISGEPEPVKLPALASAKREVIDMGDGTYEVTVTVTKQGIEGFAKLEEFLPEGATATSVTAEKAQFSQVDDRAKFVWMKVPDASEVVVKYKVEGATGSEALSSMEGAFSYLDANETKTAAVEDVAPMVAATTPPVEPVTPPATQPEPKAEPVVAQTPIEAEQKEEPLVAAAEPVQPEPAKPEPKVEPKPEPKPETPKNVEHVKPATAAAKDDKMMADRGSTPPTNTVPTPERGVTYKVQIMAGHKLVSDQYVRSHFSFNEDFSIENHEGWIKYVTGSYTVYKSARDKRESLVAAQHKFPGPFVTAYNDGQRITVQEALMISNQQWVK